MNTFTKVFFTAVFSLGVFFLFSSVQASSHEWINPFNVPDPWYQDTTSTSATSTITWTTNTDGNWNEYRSVYYYTTTTLQAPGVGDWIEQTECRLSGNVNTSSNDSCSMRSPYVREPSYLWIRITTNWAGCGTWTSNPDTVNCGAYKEKRVTLIPSAF
jgi:hypothetical protein